MLSNLIFLFGWVLGIGCLAQESNLWDLVIQMKQVETSVEYNDRYLHVWKEDKGNYSR